VFRRSFPLPGGLMRVLRPVVQILRSAMLHAAHQASVGRPIAGQLEFLTDVKFRLGSWGLLLCLGGGCGASRRVRGRSSQFKGAFGVAGNRWAMALCATLELGDLCGPFSGSLRGRPGACPSGCAALPHPWLGGIAFVPPLVWSRIKPRA
jgi:hypothetical protein